MRKAAILISLFFYSIFLNGQDLTKENIIDLTNLQFTPKPVCAYMKGVIISSSINPVTRKVPRFHVSILLDQEYSIPIEKPFTYELVLKNCTQEEQDVPVEPDRKTIINDSNIQSLRSFKYREIIFHFYVSSISSGWNEKIHEFALYGSDKVPGSKKWLKPDESIRVRGIGHWNIKHPPDVAGRGVTMQYLYMYADVEDCQQINASESRVAISNILDILISDNRGMMPKE